MTGGLGVWLCLVSVIGCLPSDPTGSGLTLLTDLLASALLGDLVRDLERSKTVSNKRDEKFEIWQPRNSLGVTSSAYFRSMDYRF